MNIRRATRPNTYTNIDNTLINDPRLSAAALGVLIYLLSKPNNWTANKKQLHKRFTTKRNKLSVNGLDNCFKEMRDAGYAELKPRMETGEDGRKYFKGSEYVIFDTSSIPLENITDPEDLRASENLPDPEDFRSPEDLPSSDISEPRTDSESLINTDLKIINTDKEDKKGNKQNLSPISPKNDLYSQFMEVMDYLSEKSGNKFRFGEKSKVVKSDKYKKVTARLKENSIEDLKAVIDVKCREWSDSVEWSKYLVPKTLFAASNFEKYLDQAENANRQPTPQTKNLVEQYRTHINYYLNNRQIKSLNGNLVRHYQKCAESSTQGEIKANKSDFAYITNKTFTEAFVFDLMHGTFADRNNTGTTPERRLSKFRQWYKSLKEYSQNKSDLRTEYIKHITR